MPGEPTLADIDRRLRRIQNSAQRKIPITTAPLPTVGAKDGDIWLSHPRGDVLKLSVKESGRVQHFWTGEPLFVDGSTRMNKGAVLYIDEVRALGSSGLTLADDSGTLGVFVEDGGQVAVGHSTPTATFHVRNSLDVAEVNIFKLEGKRPTPTNNDTMFILYSMNNDNSDSFEYARTTITAEDITDGSEEGSLLFEVARGGSLDVCLKMSATEIVVNEAGADRDFRIEGSGVANAFFVQGSDGKVGIGTSTPQKNLSVTTSGNDTIYIGEAGSATGKVLALGYYITADYGYIQAAHLGTGWKDIAINPSGGNVGIGTTTPQRSLSITTSGDSDAILLGEAGSATGKVLALSYYITGDYGRIQAAHLGTGLKNLALNPSGGNVGIGVTDPDTTLEVYKVGTQLKLSGGAADYATFAVAADGALTITTVDVDAAEGDIALMPDGNVGINEASPNAKLDVNGTTRLGDSDTNYTSVEADGDVLFVGGGGLHYGEIYAADASDTITISTAGKANKVQITSFSANGVSNGNVTPDHTNDHIITGVAGHYFCAVSMHIISAGAGGADTIGYSVYKNNGATEATNLHGQRDLAGGGTDEGSISLSGIIDCAASDTVEVWIWNNDSTDNVVIDDINLSVIQVGGT